MRKAVVSDSQLLDFFRLFHSVLAEAAAVSEADFISEPKFVFVVVSLDCLVLSSVKVEPKTQDVGVQSGLVALSELSHTKQKQIHVEEQANLEAPTERLWAPGEAIFVVFLC